MLLFGFYLLWMTIFYLNINIVISKNRNYPLWFFLSLILGPIVSFLLMFIIQDKISCKKTDDIYQHIKYIQRKSRLKRFSWRDYNKAIEMINKDFEISEFLKVKRFIDSEIEFGKVYVTIFSIIASFVITLTVGFAIYNYSSLDDFGSEWLESIEERYKDIEEEEFLIHKYEEVASYYNYFETRAKIILFSVLSTAAIILIIGFTILKSIAVRIRMLNVVKFIIETESNSK